MYIYIYYKHNFIVLNHILYSISFHLNFMISIGKNKNAKDSVGNFLDSVSETSRLSSTSMSTSSSIVRDGAKKGFLLFSI